MHARPNGPTHLSIGIRPGRTIIRRHIPCNAEQELEIASIVILPGCRFWASSRGRIGLHVLLPARTLSSASGSYGFCCASITIVNVLRRTHQHEPDLRLTVNRVAVPRGGCCLLPAKQTDLFLTLSLTSSIHILCSN
jgi:hypothetical protein